MFTKAIELDPISGVVFFHRGNAYLHIREYENALFDFDRHDFYLEAFAMILTFKHLRIYPFIQKFF